MGDERNLVSAVSNLIGVEGEQRADFHPGPFRHLNAGIAQPPRGLIAHHLLSGRRRIDTVLVLHRSEFLRAGRGQYCPALSLRQSVEDEPLELERVLRLRIDKLAHFVEVRNLLADDRSGR